MKKLFTLLLPLMLVAALSFQNVQAQQSTTPAKTARVKKDGTPDRRYKENKGAADTAQQGPRKKDGSLDMRYKANKTQKK